MCFVHYLIRSVQIVYFIVARFCPDITINGCLFVGYSLTPRADVGAAVGDAELLDGRAAAWAGLTFAAKDARKREVATTFAFGIDVVFVGAAALLQRQVEDVFDPVTKNLEFGIWNIADESCGVNLSGPQRFIGVDIADAGHDRLVEQRGFDTGIFAALETLVQNLWRKIIFKWLGPKALHEVNVWYFYAQYEPHPAKLS